MNRVIMMLLVAVMCLVAVAPAIASGSSFPAEVVSHSADLDGSRLYNDPQAVLGEPTTWNADCHAVSMVCPAWGTNESGDKVITTLTDGSYIIVKFDHRVEDDPDNPLGIDFLVFGNAFYQGSGSVTPDTDMETYHITNAGGGVDPGDSVNVAVSQDGTNWYYYSSGPYGDTGYPTNAKKWDRINHQWGDLLDFTKPIDPSIDPAHFINKCVADVIDNYYCGSGGGTGFDLAESGYSWIQYIKVYGDASHAGGEIDAFADVSHSDSDSIITATWYQFQKDEIASGWTTDSAPANDPALVWWEQTSGTGMGGIDVTPIVADGAVYVLDYQGVLWSFDTKTGEENWHTDLTEGSGTFELSTPAYNEGIVYAAVSSGSAGQGAGRVCAVYANNGTIRECDYYGLQSFQLNTPERYACGKIYIGNWKGGASHTEDNGTYYCIDADNVSNLIWSKTAPYVTGYYWAGAAIVGDYIIYGDDKADVTCLNKDSGAFVDYINVSEQCGVTSVEEIRSSIVWNESTGRIYFTGKKSSPRSGHAYAVGFNPTTGHFDTLDYWVTNIDYSTSTPVVYDGRVYVCIGGGDGKVLKCLDEANGNILYTYDIADGASQASPAVSVAYGRVHIYFTTNMNNGSAYCIEDTGTELVEKWIWNPPEPDNQYILQGMAISDGMVYFGTDYGRVYALRARTFWEGNVTLVENSTVTVTAHNSGKSYEVNQTTALGALDAASEAGGFNYTISDEWYPAMGLYVDSIADKECEGMEGWLYWVNYPTDPKPVISVDKYAVKNGDVVTYYYGEWTTTPENSSMVIRIYVHTASAIFDTGASKNPYPSIFGTHYGNITPSHDVYVTKMYTYPCAGTGGHSEEVAFYNSTTGAPIANGTWNGYAVGDYHYIEFDESFVLHHEVTYNFVIRTGSYPQIHHKSVLDVGDGTITCTNFTDANGRTYNDRILAIKLE